MTETRLKPPSSPEAMLASQKTAAANTAAADNKGGGQRRFGRLFARRRIKSAGFVFILGVLAALALPPLYLLPLCFVSFSALALLLEKIDKDSAAADGIIPAAKTADSTAATADSTAAKTAPAPPHRLLIRAAAIGWLFGFGYFTAGLWWLANAMTVDIAQFGWAIPFTVFGLPAFLACYYGLAAALAVGAWHALRLPAGGIARLAALAAAFAPAEYLRGVLFTGFPWNAIGYTLMPCPALMQADAVLGLNGMNAAAVFIYALPSLWWRNRRKTGRQSGAPFAAGAARLGLGLPLLLLAAIGGFGLWRLAQAPSPAQAEWLRPRGGALPAEQTAALPFRVRLIQPAIAQEEKQDPAAQEENFSRLLQLSAAAPKDGGRQPDLIIWPETAVPYLLNYNQAALAQIGDNLRPGQFALIGAVRAEEARNAPNSRTEADGDKDAARYRFFNSMLLISADGQIIDYADKAHLVPFGEYLPQASLLRAFGLSALAAAGPYSAADKRRPIILPNGLKILPLICYEAIFPQESRLPAPASAASNGGAKNQAADIIINITNDAWFGNTPGPRQHLAQARLRAVETGLPLLRAANNGISAYIDAFGRLRAALPLNQIGFLDIDFKIQPQKR